MRRAAAVLVVVILGACGGEGGGGYGGSLDGVYAMSFVTPDDSDDPRTNRPEHNGLSISGSVATFRVSADNCEPANAEVSDGAISAVTLLCATEVFEIPRFGLEGHEVTDEGSGSKTLVLVGDPIGAQEIGPDGEFARDLQMLAFRDL